MWVESWIFAENNSKKDKTDKELIDEQINILDFQKRKEKLRHQIETNESLTKLRELLESDYLSPDNLKALENIVNNEEINEKSIAKIFEKIDEIASNPKIDLYLPVSLRITKEEYIQAIKDDDKRQALLKKIDTILWALANHISSWNWDKLNLFSWFLWLLDRNLVIIQENTIDIKNSLLNWWI